MTIRNTPRKMYRWLVGLTAVFVLSMLIWQANVTRRIPQVTVTAVKEITVEDTVVCAGTVKQADGVEVAVDVPCVAGDVLVKEGDRVQAGDALITVDRTATLALAVSAGLPSSQTAAASAALPETVTAPQSGVVSAVHVKKGDTLSTEKPCVVLGEDGGVHIAVTVRENMLPRLAVGQRVTVTGVAFERKAYTGTLTSIAKSARSRVSGTTAETVVDAVVTLDAGQADASLLPGLNAKATVAVAKRDRVTVVPYESITQTEEGKPAVYCVQNGKAFRREVITGEEHAEGMEILSGVRQGEWVVTDAEALSGDAVAVNTEAV